MTEVVRSIFMPSLTLTEIPEVTSAFSGEEPSNTDKDLIALYLSKIRGWSLKESLDQSDGYHIQTRDDFYASLEEGDSDQIDRCVQAWIYTPMEVYLITSL